MNRQLAERRQFLPRVHDERPNRLRAFGASAARRTGSNEHAARRLGGNAWRSAFIAPLAWRTRRIQRLNCDVACDAWDCLQSGKWCPNASDVGYRSLFGFLGSSALEGLAHGERFRIHDSPCVPDYATKPERFDFRALHFSAAAIFYRRPHCSFLDDGGGRWHTMDCRRFAGNPAHARPLHFRCAEDLCGGVSSVRYGRSLWFPALTGETSADFTRSSVRTMAVILLISLVLPGTRQARCGGGPECFRCE